MVEVSVDSLETVNGQQTAGRVIGFLVVIWHHSEDFTRLADLLFRSNVYLEPSSEFRFSFSSRFVRDEVRFSRAFTNSTSGGINPLRVTSPANDVDVTTGVTGCLRRRLQRCDLV
jgi:hypothetical protein